MTRWSRHTSLRPFTTLKAGGAADFFKRAGDVEILAEIALESQIEGQPVLYLGSGSNVLPSDDGVPGRVVVNEASRIEIDRTRGTVIADSGCWFQELFLKTAQAGLGGLEFAVGIPGTVGGALVSNAGAYRSNVSEFLREIEIVEGGERRWEDPAWMQFSYRDSILRRPHPPQCALLRVRLELPKRNEKAIYDEGRDYQRQRISKQPPSASAGSFFKNVNDPSVAKRLDNLPERLRGTGVVPAGYLIEKAGLMGHRIGGAMFAHRHANFIVNVGGASATDIRRLASLGKLRVQEQFGVALEEEVLYLGNWSKFLTQDD
jgi:UDP-N-acetylmuramate dehydrogenase